MGDRGGDNRVLALSVVPVYDCPHVYDRSGTDRGGSVWFAYRFCSLSDCRFPDGGDKLFPFYRDVEEGHLPLAHPADAVSCSLLADPSPMVGNTWSMDQHPDRRHDSYDCYGPRLDKPVQEVSF